MSAIKGINTNTATPDRMIEFKYDKNELKEKFIDWTASLEDTPLDMALSVITYIEKKYYPVYIFHFNYTASWSATSIYLHTEEYTVYESKTVFVDRYGGEHSQCGTDRIYMNGADRDVPYQAVSKQVPVTKTRTIQNKQPSNGRIFDQRLDIIYNSSANSDFDRWLGSFSLENAVSYSSNKLQNTNIEDSGASYNNAMDYAEKALAIEAKKMCVSQIPGNSYENFSIDCLQKTCTSEVVILPVYKLKYTYSEKEYTVWFDGENANNTLFDSHPVNEEQKSVIEKINNEIITQKNRKIICIVLLVGVLFLGAPVIINLIMSILHSFTVSLFVTAVGYICFAILQIKKISAIDADVNGKKLYIKNYNENLRKKRMAVADIVKNHSLSCDERIAAIQRTIES